MSDLLARSAEIIDSGRGVPPNWQAAEVEVAEVADGVAMCLSFGHSIAIRTSDGLLVFDTSTLDKGPAIVEGLRGWSKDPVCTVVYTHGHLDHIGGSGAFVDEAAASGHQAPTFVGHANIVPRMRRYERMAGWQARISARQFRGRPVGPEIESASRRIGLMAPPSLTYVDEMEFTVGGLEVHLEHARGETDDHTWAWIPERRMVCCGDLFIWAFPNAGNPQKVQRYPGDWAAALRAIAARRPELLLPAHGLPIAGAERIASVLDRTAGVLERLEADVLAMMNDGATLDQIVASVRVPEASLSLPYLRPSYDEPEFLIHNIWRLYGGWWDGNPARLKPPTDRELSTEVVALAGGVEPLLERAQRASADGDHRLACQLVEWAAAVLDDRGVHEVRAEVYSARREAETSLMARGIFGEAAYQSERRARAES